MLFKIFLGGMEYLTQIKYYYHSEKGDFDMCLYCESCLHNTKDCPKLAEAGIDPDDFIKSLKLDQPRNVIVAPIQKTEQQLTKLPWEKKDEGFFVQNE